MKPETKEPTGHSTVNHNAIQGNNKDIIIKVKIQPDGINFLLAVHQDLPLIQLKHLVCRKHSCPKKILTPLGKTKR